MATTTASLRPYLLRAVYQWAVDSGLTPHILVNAAVEGVQVPQAYVKDGQITLNVHPNAVQRLELGNDKIQFSARFGGQVFTVVVPMAALLAVFARETGRGLFFQEEGGDEPTPEPQPPSTPKRPALKRVK